MSSLFKSQKIILIVGALVFSCVGICQEAAGPESVQSSAPKDEPIPKLPQAAPPLPIEIENDEPAVFQQEGLKTQPKVLEQQKVEDQPMVLMDQSKPDFIPLFFEPERNGVVYAHQEIEFDLTNPLILRVGPLAVTAAGVGMRMSRETGEFFEIEFGLDLQTRYANMYMISFQWPVELVPDGVIELFNDQGEVLWRREANEEQVTEWKNFVTGDAGAVISADAKDGKKKSGKTRVGIERLKLVGHDQSSYGLFGKEIFDIPVWKIEEPFRFCVTKDAPEGRLAICSKRYRFIRKGGRYWVVSESKTVVPKVLVNDKPVTLKGSAVFVDDKKPIKFAALMGNGTYFEFVSFPKRITVVDMVLNDETNQVEVIGYGPPPLGPIERIERHAKDYWDFLNFAPTIGDFRKFWKATFPAQGGSLFLRGYGGAPFKQPFIFDKLPRKSVRPRIHIKSPRSTYARTVKLKGETTAPAIVTSKEENAKNSSGTEFQWQYLARNRGEMNSAEIFVKDGNQTYRAFHEIYKGYPREISTRLTGVLSNNLELVLLGEIATQWWFERLLWWDNTQYSLQRWGVAAKYFKALAAIGGSKDGQSLIRLDVANIDLKYRLTPGIWARDPTLGIMLDAQQVQIEDFKAQMAGVGVLWARSMPKFFDSIFNIVPFMRYPKWVDVEAIYYPLALSKSTRLGVNMSVNFHGKVLWTERFFGEAGFGLKVFQFDDLVERKAIALAVAYGTIGLGYNF